LTLFLSFAAIRQDNLPAALTSYQASLDIFDRLAKMDPSNGLWQRDLALSCGRVALVMRFKGIGRAR
jgi:hypothetical protein